MALHPVGCSQVGLDLEMTARTLKNLGRHPNVAAVLVLGLGCERLTSTELAEGIAESGSRLRGSPSRMWVEASKRWRRLDRPQAGPTRFNFKREQFGLEHLAVATECGGTDALGHPGQSSRGHSGGYGGCRGRHCDDLRDQRVDGHRALMAARAATPRWRTRSTRWWRSARLGWPGRASTTALANGRR